MLPNPELPVYLVIFTEEILNGKLHFYEVYTHIFSQIQSVNEKILTRGILIFYVL